jgi:hypothetical protein
MDLVMNRNTFMNVQRFFNTNLNATKAKRTLQRIIAWKTKIMSTKKSVNSGNSLAMEQAFWLKENEIAVVHWVFSWIRQFEQSRTSINSR